MMNFYCSEKEGHADHEDAQAGDQEAAVEDQ
jgi:hypothetical protein